MEAAPAEAAASSGRIASNSSCAPPISTGCCRPNIAPAWSGTSWRGWTWARCTPQVKAVDGHAGRPAIDPAILMALWLYATLEGVGSARAVARLCEEHDGFGGCAGA